MIVTTIAELNAVASTVQSGETVQIAPGVYEAAAWEIIGRNWLPRVTFEPLDPLDPPTIKFMRHQNSSGFRVTGLRFRGISPGTTSPGAVELRSCDDYRFDHNDVEGGETCLKLGGGNNVEVDHNRLSGPSQAEIKFWGLNGFEIHHNDCLGIMFPDAETHGDRIQGAGNSSNGRIHHNKFYMNHRPQENGQDPSVWGAIYQGAFFDNGTYTDILVDQNIIAHTGLRGIGIGSSYSGNVRAENNLVFNVPSDGHPHLTGDYGSDNPQEGSQIDVPGTGNISQQAGEAFVIQKDDPGQPNFFNAVFQNLMRGMGYVDDDFQPLVDLGGAGPQSLFAEMFGEPLMDFNTIIAATIDNPAMGTVEIVGTPGPDSTDHKVRWNKNPDWLATNGPGTGTYTIQDQAGNQSTATWQQDLTNTPNVAMADVFAAVDDSVASIDMAVLGNDTA